MSSSLPQFTKGKALALITVLTVGSTAITGALDLGEVPGLIAITGFVILLPLTAIIGDQLPYVASADEGAKSTTEASASAPDSPVSTDEDDHAVARLRQRYARGEIDDAEFEERLDRLLATENLDETVETDRSLELE